MRQGLRGMLWEEVAMLQPWGFSLADIGVETHVWRGEHESAAAREFVAERLPRARLTVWPGEGRRLHPAVGRDRRDDDRLMLVGPFRAASMRLPALVSQFRLSKTRQ
jgi:hypothetical protein